MRLAVRKFFIYFDATYFIVINVIFKMDHIKLIYASDRLYLLCDTFKLLVKVNTEVNFDLCVTFAVLNFGQIILLLISVLHETTD